MTDSSPLSTPHREGSPFHHLFFFFFFQYKLPETLAVTKLLVFGPVTLLCGLMCGTFLFYSMTMARWLASAAALLQPLEAHQSCSETVPPLMRRISVWFPHWKGSVNGARDSTVHTQLRLYSQKENTVLCWMKLNWLLFFRNDTFSTHFFT